MAMRASQINCMHDAVPGQQHPQMTKHSTHTHGWHGPKDSLTDP